jgi:hypothetical protein
MIPSRSSILGFGQLRQGMRVRMQAGGAERGSRLQLPSDLLYSLRPCDFALRKCHLLGRQQ